MSRPKRIAVILFQLGGPDTQEAVEPFLYNLFCDPDIINFPGSFLARKTLARWISRTRSKVVRQHYAEIGGGSPIRRLTEQQATALEAALRPHISVRAIVAMRYWQPDTHEAIRVLHSEPFDELVLLPLYPHYSFATTRSSLKEWNRLFQSGRAMGERSRPVSSTRVETTVRVPNGRASATQRSGRDSSAQDDEVPAHVIEHFFDHPDYIAAIVERINEVLDALPNRDHVHLLFSAHGLPLSLVAKGDPYPNHIETTVQLVRQLGAWPNSYSLCYQSRVGPQRWLQPSLLDTIDHLAHTGAKNLLVIPISFVTDHIETLHEINIEARRHAEAAGISEFYVMPALNDSPLLIRALADLVLRAVGMRFGVASLTT